MALSFILGLLIGGYLMHLMYYKKWEDAVETVRNLRLETTQLRGQVKMFEQLFQIKEKE